MTIIELVNVYFNHSDLVFTTRSSTVLVWKRNLMDSLSLSDPFKSKENPTDDSFDCFMVDNVWH